MKSRIIEKSAVKGVKRALLQFRKVSIYENTIRQLADKCNKKVTENYSLEEKINEQFI